MISKDEIDAFLEDFLHDFGNLDWPAFSQLFAESASVFFPPRFADRLASGDEFARRWRLVFAELRSRSSSEAPPYMQLVPKDLLVQYWDSFVVVTFVLDSHPANLDRRTLVITKIANELKIVHLHGSTVYPG